jgi:hypothetical protein
MADLQTIETKIDLPEGENEDLKIEVVDDTPPEDRGRQPLPKDIVEELEKDTLDEYSDKVKTRIAQMKKVWHDERREKEKVAREREEALAFAQRAYEENKQLKQRLGQGEKVLISEVTKAATNELNVAKESLKRAYESGDADKITEAQEALTDVKIKLKEYQNFRPSLQEEDSRVQRVPQTAPAPRQGPDFKAERWKDRNTWFGPNKVMTATALGLHEELVDSGVDPTSDEYYQQIDSTMRRRFPDYFGEETAQTRDSDERPTSRKTTTVVAPATRSTAPRQIRLTSTEAAIAKRLGLSPEAYAREKIKLENNNG